MSSSSEEIKLGKKLRLSKKSNEVQEYYTSQVLDVIDEKVFLIGGPIKKSQLILIHSGDIINISYIVENKGIYSFDAKVLSRESSPIYTLKVERISKIKKNQQRKHFRLCLKKDVKKIHEIENNNECVIYKEKCKSKDISGGGMRLYCNYRHRLGDEVICRFKIEDSEVNVKAIVKRIKELDSFNYKYSIGVSFVDIGEADRDDLIRYIFEKQRILRNKGLI